MKNGQDLLSVLRAGSNVYQRDGRDETLLHRVSWGCDLSMVRTLVAEGADIDARGNMSPSVLHRAAEAGKVDTVI